MPDWNDDGNDWQDDDWNEDDADGHQTYNTTTTTTTAMEEQEDNADDWEVIEVDLPEDADAELKAEHQSFTASKARLKGLMQARGYYNAKLKPAGKGKGRGARSRSVTRGQDAAALVEETVGFYVKATGKDEALM